MPSYTFRLDQFQITDTRALINDTDVVTFNLSVNPGGQSFTLSKNMGDVDNGNHAVGLEFTGIEIDDPTKSVTLTLAIVNAGHDGAAVEAQLQKSLDSIVMAGTKAVTGLAAVEIAGAMAAVDLVLTALFADCDGTVAADTLQSPISAFDALIPANGRTTTNTKFYPGTDSAVGCGGNSKYYVTYSLIRTNPGEANQPNASDTFIILSRASGLVLDVPGGSTAAGTKIQQFADNGTASQHWKFIPVDDGFFQIQSQVSKLFLGVVGASHSTGAQIQQAPNSGGHEQHWKFISVTEPPTNLPFPVLQAVPQFFKIQSRLSGLVLDVPSLSAAPRTFIQQFTDNGGNNQLWQLLALEGNIEPVTVLHEIHDPVQVGKAL